MRAYLHLALASLFWSGNFVVGRAVHGRIQLYAPALSEADLALTGVEPIKSVEQAVLDSVRASGDRAVAVVPEGPYVVPAYRPEAAAGRS